MGVGLDGPPKTPQESPTWEGRLGAQGLPRQLRGGLHAARAGRGLSSRRRGCRGAGGVGGGCIDLNARGAHLPGDAAATVAAAGGALPQLAGCRGADLHAIVVLTGSGAVHCWLGRSACCCPLLSLLRLLRPAHVSPLHSWRRSRWGGGIGCQVTPLPPCLVNLRGKGGGGGAPRQAPQAGHQSCCECTLATVMLQSYWKTTDGETCLLACLPAPASPVRPHQAHLIRRERSVVDKQVGDAARHEALQAGGLLGVGR